MSFLSPAPLLSLGKQLDASKNAMGTSGAKAFGDMLLGNKTIQTLDVSDNSFGKVQVGDQVKLKSSGEMKLVTKIDVYDEDDESEDNIQVQGSGSNIKPSEFEWESQVPAFCAGVAASPSLISVSSTFRHALAVLFLTPPLFPAMYVARCFFQ